MTRFGAELRGIVFLAVEQFGRIAPYWIAGLAAGSALSVFAKRPIARLAERAASVRPRFLAIAAAGVLGAASPLCMYGTVPLIAALGKKGVPQHILAAFMVSSVLINPNLFVFGFYLGAGVALLRLTAAIAVGMIAGGLVHLAFKGKQFFSFDGFAAEEETTEARNGFRAYASSLHRGVVATAPYLLLGILLTALVDRYAPRDFVASIFSSVPGVGVLVAASLGVPVYVCGGGTIPLIAVWMERGMGVGSALAFMISGPATKLTNLSAVKILLGGRHFVLYIVFSMVISVLFGWAVDIVLAVSA